MLAPGLHRTIQEGGGEGVSHLVIQRNSVPAQGDRCVPTCVRPWWEGVSRDEVRGEGADLVGTLALTLRGMEATGGF